MGNRIALRAEPKPDKVPGISCILNNASDMFSTLEDNFAGLSSDLESILIPEGKLVNEVSVHAGEQAEKCASLRLRETLELLMYRISALDDKINSIRKRIEL